jgi:hypothetical protein
MGKQLVSFITCGCESSASFFCNLQSRARTHTVLVIGLYKMHKLFGNPTTTTKTGRHEIAEILQKVALNTKNQIKSVYTISNCVG